VRIVLTGYQHDQHISYWSDYTRYREQLHSFIHSTVKPNFTEGIQENTHTFRPTKVKLIPINNQQHLKKVCHIHRPVIQPCPSSTPMDCNREHWTFHSQQSDSHPH